MPTDRVSSLSHRSAMGYTMVELVVVLVLVGVMAAFALPKLQNLMSLRDDTWRDSLIGGLRYAQKSAVSHRRLVCATVSNTQLTLTIASANPASACDTNLSGPTGSTGIYATSASSTMATVVAPSGVIYFQPDGRVTSDGAGGTVASRTITATGVTAITLIGETGYVE